MAQNIDAAPPGWAQDVVRPFKNPIFKGGSIAVLRGNLAPGGAIVKQAAATPTLMQHEGRAVVFDSLADMAARIDSPDLDVKADDILVLRNAGPKGAPGMPEAGYIPIPKKLAQKGLKDMVRMSDARMSGTAFGAIVLHITPESAVGGPLALVKNGDRIRLDVAGRRLELLVSDDELAARRKQWKAAEAAQGRRARLSQAVHGHGAAGRPRLRFRIPDRTGHRAHAGEMNGQTVAILESRLGEQIVELIAKRGGKPLHAPALSEIPDIDPAFIARLVRDWQAAPVKAAIFQTGVGTRALFKTTDELGLTATLLELLAACTVVVRGPKPTGALSSRGVRIDLAAVEPYTTTEVIAKLETLKLAGERVVVQRYGGKNVELESWLQAQGRGSSRDSGLSLGHA